VSFIKQTEKQRDLDELVKNNTHCIVSSDTQV